MSTRTGLSVVAPRFRISAGGLVPDNVAAVPKFQKTAGAMDFNWGEDTGALVGALFLFLYLDFIGSSITFVSLGQVRQPPHPTPPPPAGRASPRHHGLAGHEPAQPVQQTNSWLCGSPART
jgi:hypothetical protein